MDATSGPVATAGITGVSPGLGGGMTHVVERVSYMVAERLRHRCLRVPQPGLVVTDAAFDFSSSCIV